MSHYPRLDDIFDERSATEVSSLIEKFLVRANIQKRNYGLLFANNATAVTLALLSPDDISDKDLLLEGFDQTSWIPLANPRLNVINMNDYRFLLNTNEEKSQENAGTDTGAPSGFDYYVYFCPANPMSQIPNRLLHILSSGSIKWCGNVLVVRCLKGQRIIQSIKQGEEEEVTNEVLKVLRTKDQFNLRGEGQPGLSQLWGDQDFDPNFQVGDKDTQGQKD